MIFMDDFKKYFHENHGWKERSSKFFNKKKNVIIIIFSDKIEFYIGKVLFSSETSAGIRSYTPYLNEFFIDLKNGKTTVDYQGNDILIFVPKRQFKDIDSVMSSGHLKTCEKYVKYFIDIINSFNKDVIIQDLKYYSYYDKS